VGSAALRPGTGADLRVTVEGDDIAVTGISARGPGPPRPAQALFALRSRRGRPSDVRGKAVLVLLVDALLVLHACHDVVTVLVAALQVHDHAAAQDDGDNPGGDDEQVQGIVRKAQMHVDAQVSKTAGGKAAAASGHAGRADP